MDRKAQLAYETKNRDAACKVARILAESGFEIELVQKTVDPKRLVILLLSRGSQEDTLYEDLPWLKEQFAFSSFKGFRLFPVFLYSSSLIDPEEAFAGGLGEVYESVFSGEFKPFGWDLDKNHLDPEFLRVLEESYQE
jgi:hypothetical protein